MRQRRKQQRRKEVVAKTRQGKAKKRPGVGGRRAAGRTNCEDESPRRTASSPKTVGLKRAASLRTETRQAQHQRLRRKGREKATSSHRRLTNQGPVFYKKMCRLFKGHLALSSLFFIIFLFSPHKREGDLLVEAHVGIRHEIDPVRVLPWLLGHSKREGCPSAAPWLDGQPWEKKTR